MLNPANAHDFTKNATPSGKWPVDPLAGGGSRRRTWLVCGDRRSAAYLEAYGGASSFRISAFRHKVVKQIEAEVVTGDGNLCLARAYGKMAGIRTSRPGRRHQPRPNLNPFMRLPSPMRMSAVTIPTATPVLRRAHAVAHFRQCDWRVSVAMFDRSVAGAAREFSRDISLAGPTHLEVEVPVDNADARNVAIRCAPAQPAGLLHHSRHRHAYHAQRLRGSLVLYRRIPRAPDRSHRT